MGAMLGMEPYLGVEMQYLVIRYPDGRSRPLETQRAPKTRVSQPWLTVLSLRSLERRAGLAQIILFG